MITRELTAELSRLFENEAWNMRTIARYEANCGDITPEERDAAVAEAARLDAIAIELDLKARGEA